jgi:threonine dehydratase
MVSLADIRAARRRVSRYVKRTPLERNSTLSDLLGTNLYLKMESLQKTGSFKPRGAFNQILGLTAGQRRQGVVAISAGNFAQGVAYAGQVLGIRTSICMPASTPQNYVEATKEYGAKVELHDSMEEALAHMDDFRRRGWGFVHAWDHPLQMAGNGVVGLEIIEDQPEITDVIVSIGGGGLIAGVSAAIKALKPAVRVWGVETVGADSMGQALRAGHVVKIQPTSLARTLGAPYVSEDALWVGQHWLAGYELVTDAEAFAAQVLLLERAKVMTELAASATLAAAQRLKGRFTKTDHVVLLICGGNDSVAGLAEYHRLFVEGHAFQENGIRGTVRLDAAALRQGSGKAHATRGPQPLRTPPAADRKGKAA